MEFIYETSIYLYNFTNITSVHIQGNLSIYLNIETKAFNRSTSLTIVNRSSIRLMLRKDSKETQRRYSMIQISKLMHNKV